MLKEIFQMTKYIDKAYGNAQAAKNLWTPNRTCYGANHIKI